MTREQVEQEVRSVPYWWHSIDVGQGVTTPGAETAGFLAQHLQRMHWPEVRGKSVLDIGAWDGFFSFEAERRGASSVTALDHYVWSMDISGYNELSNRCRARGEVPPLAPTTEFFDSARLPGKRGFDVARRLRGSTVKDVVADFTVTDPAQLGTFDVVLFLGVLYHLEDPLGGLKRVAQLTREVAVIETEAILLRGHDQPLCEFFPGNELTSDPSNWWAPNEKALAGMCRAAGFRRVEIVTPPPFSVKYALRLSRVSRYRAVAHAWK